MLMEEKFLNVECPESPAKQIVQLNAEGNIRWCSRWVGSPTCNGACLANKNEVLPEEAEA